MNGHHEIKHRVHLKCKSSDALFEVINRLNNKNFNYEHYIVSRNLTTNELIIDVLTTHLIMYVLREYKERAAEAVNKVFNKYIDGYLNSSPVKLDLFGFSFNDYFVSAHISYISHYYGICGELVVAPAIDVHCFWEARYNPTRSLAYFKKELNNNTVYEYDNRGKIISSSLIKQYSKYQLGSIFEKFSEKNY